MTSKQSAEKYAKEIEKYFEQKKKEREEKITEFLEKFWGYVFLPLLSFTFIGILLWFVFIQYYNEILAFANTPLGLVIIAFTLGYIVRKKRWLDI